MNKISRSLQILTYSSLFISLCTSMFFQFYAKCQGRNFTWKESLFIFLATFISYSFVQVANSSFKEMSFDRPKFLLKHRKLFLKLLVLASFLLLALTFQLSISSLILLSHLGVLVLLYETLFFKNIGLRKVPFLKPFIISYIWAMAIAVFEPKGFHLSFTSLSFLSFIDCFLFIFSLTILFDLRDTQRDLSSGLKTFSTQFSRRFVLTFSFFLFFLSLYTHSLLRGAIHNSLITIIILLVSFLSLLPRLKSGAHDYYFLIGIDGLILIKSIYI